jgi:hypothetical protein
MSLNPKLGLSAFDWSDYTLIKPMLSHRFTATEPNILFPAIGARIALTPTPEPVVEAHALHSGTRMPGGPGLHSMSNVMYGLYQNWTPPIQLAHPHP